MRSHSRAHACTLSRTSALARTHAAASRTLVASRTQILQAGGATAFAEVDRREARGVQRLRRRHGQDEALLLQDGAEARAHSLSPRPGATFSCGCDGYERSAAEAVAVAAVAAVAAAADFAQKVAL
eukprot:4638058-Pleurochrysis_carterae.AAC.2